MKNIEESARHKKYLLIKLKLKEQFNSHEWLQIASNKSDIFIQNQKKILKKLMGDSKMYKKYFQLFFNNHLKILNWYMLALQNKRDIQPYVFKQLLSQKINFYQEKHQNINKSIKNSQNISQQQSQNISFMRPSSQKIQYVQEGVLKKFFQDLSEINQKQHKRKALDLKLFEREKQNLNIDSHQLYLRTFDACNGRKYVSYDYERHMKGMSQRQKYNTCLRKNQKSICSSKQKQSSCLNIQKFSQFIEFKSLTQRQKCSLLPMNEILNKKQINNMNGFRQIIQQNKSSKIVFVNHLGKPITYYIKKDKFKNNKNNRSHILSSN